MGDKTNKFRTISKLMLVIPAFLVENSSAQFKSLYEQALSTSQMVENPDR